jgi:hypothetical protein
LRITSIRQHPRSTRDAKNWLLVPGVEDCRVERQGRRPIRATGFSRDDLFPAGTVLKTGRTQAIAAQTGKPRCRGKIEQPGALGLTGRIQLAHALRELREVVAPDTCGGKMNAADQPVAPLPVE